jgi:hypothetical protein
METLLPSFQATCEAQVSASQRKAVVAMDETFFGDFLILVLMDLRSGYLLLEDISNDRCFETWYAKTTPRLESLGIEVNHAISDRAKALIKLAVSGWECASGADVFHAQQDVSRWLGLRLSRQSQAAEQRVDAVEDQAHETASKAEQAQQILMVLEAEAERDQAKQAQSDYPTHLRGVSDDLHPFSLNDAQIKSTQTVETELESRAQAFEQIADAQGIADKKQRLKKFRNQIEALAVTVDFWWLWVRETLQTLAIDPALEDWLTTGLLPVVYWHHQLHKTQNTQTRKRYRSAWQQTVQTLSAHPLTATLSDREIQRWITWAETMARGFHRSSSAVEGRNGCLSQMYRNGRGLTPRRLAALTVIHNYGIQRADGTTAAMRLFDTEFPELFTWLVEQMGELPLPRKGRERVIHNPLKLIDVPA